MDRPARAVGGGGDGGGRRDDRGARGGRRRSRSRERRQRRRSRSRDRRRGGGGRSGGTTEEEQKRIREMLLAEAAKRNPDAANVLQSESMDKESLQRALMTANALNIPTTQQQLHQQAQAAAGHSGSRMNNGPRRTADSDRVFMELHVGSLPEQMREEADLVRFLNDAIQQRRLNLEPGNPVVQARINHVGHFAFVLFRSKEEATNALQLSGLPCMGNTLKMDRPKGYAQKSSGANNTPVDESQIIANAFLNCPPIPSIPGMSREDLKHRLEESIAQYGTPTSVVQLSNLEQATHEEVDSEVRKYGQVTAVKPSASEPGTFLVKMASIQEAEKLVEMRRRFMDRVVRATFRPLAEWTST